MKKKILYLMSCQRYIFCSVKINFIQQSYIHRHTYADKMKSRNTIVLYFLNISNI